MSELDKNKTSRIRGWMWDEPWFVELSGEEKLLYLQLLTNYLVGEIGIYELPVSWAGYQTCMGRDEVETILSKFEADGKVVRDGYWIWVVDYTKYNPVHHNARAYLRRLRRKRESLNLLKAWAEQYGYENKLQEVGIV